MKSKIFLFPLLIMILFCASALEGWFSYLIFPAVAVMVYYLQDFEGQRKGNKILVNGLCLLVIFTVWQLLFTNEVNILRTVIYTIIIIAAFEGWHFTTYTSPNVWGLMNLVVFYISLEYLMIEWLPYDISHWILGAPFLQDQEGSTWALYTGFQGITLWIWLGGLLLYKTISDKYNFIALFLGLLIIILPVIFTPGISDDPSFYAQGEWVGRTAIWVSVLILAYSFVKRKTLEKK
ncbi:MAG: hypothetical protein ACNS60_20890 [Candidatus Cyclobacteriaceae bacterium M2_1C_046]